MANTVLTPTIIAKEALMQLENECIMGNLVHRDYKNEFVKIGDVVTIRKPVKFSATSGATMAVQDVTEASTTLTIDKRYHVAWKFNTHDLTMKISDYSERYIKPACIVLANKVDEELCKLYKDVPTASGTPGSTPSRFADLAAAARMLDDAAVPTDSRNLVLNPAGHWALADGLKGLFLQNRVEQIIGKGYLGNVAGFNIFSDQNIQSHTAGTATTLYVVNAGTLSETYPATGDYQTVTVATGTGTWCVGDIVTFASVNAVNPISKADLGYLKQFTVTTASAGGAGSLLVSPPCYYGAAGSVTAPYNNSSAAIGTTDVIGILGGNHVANLAFHKNAFALVMVPLDEPDGAAWKARVTHNNFSIRVIKGYDMVNDYETIRLDILFGVKTLYPQLACRVMG